MFTSNTYIQSNLCQLECHVHLFIVHRVYEKRCYRSLSIIVPLLLGKTMTVVMAKQLIFTVNCKIKTIQVICSICQCLGDTTNPLKVISVGHVSQDGVFLQGERLCGKGRAQCWGEWTGVCSGVFNRQL